MKTRSKALILVLCVVLLVSASVLGTMAYLTAKTEKVVNTFTLGEVGALSLNETSGTPGETSRVHKIIPGTNTAKNPKVAYDAEDNDEAVYVFVEIGAENWKFTNNTYTYEHKGEDCLTWTVNDGWTAVDGESGVYYKALAAGTDLAATSIIKNDVIAVDGNNVNQNNIEAVATGAGELTFVAYAIQQAGFEDDVPGAWAALKAQVNS